MAAAELRQLLVDESLWGRAVYVAPSFAGFTGLLVGSNYAGALVGLLLLDPSHPRQGAEALRILADAPPGPHVEKLRAFLAGFGPVWEQSCRDVTGIRWLGSLHLRVLAAGRFDLVEELPEGIKGRLMHSRHQMLSEYCALGPRASLEVVADAGRDISHQAADVVVLAIKRMLETAL
ncbi:MAG TPA: hypothetical protein VGD81_16050 [Opitutaceae bacterium]